MILSVIYPKSIPIIGQRAQQISRLHLPSLLRYMQRQYMYLLAQH